MCGHTSACAPRQIVLCGHTAASAERSDSAAELRGRKRPRPRQKEGTTPGHSAPGAAGPHCPPLLGDAEKSAAPLPAVRRGLWTPGHPAWTRGAARLGELMLDLGRGVSSHNLSTSHFGNCCLAPADA